jgi:glycosyltransferase involved in cell wall biosynthesis
MRKLNVLHLNASTQIGGTETMILRFLSAADKSQFNFFVASFFSGGTLLTQAEKQGAKIALFKITKLYNFFQLIWAFINLCRYLKKNKIDIVHIYGYWTNIFGRIAAKLVKTPVIITGQRTEDNWRKSIHSLLDRLTSHWVDSYISVFNKGKELLIQRDQIAEEKIVVIPNGIDPDWVIGGRGEGKLPLVGMIASFSSFKAYEQLILAAPQITQKFPEVKFILVGGGEKKNEISKLIRELKLNPYFIMTGLVEDVRPILAILSVFVLVTHSEGMPVSIIEAMSFGLPVIASNVGGIPELIEDGINGILIGPDNHNQLASAIVELLDNPDKRKLIGERVKAKIVRDFSIQKMTDKIEAQYIDLARKKGLVC